MVNRDTSLVAIAIALVAWGVFRALYLPGLVSDLSTPLFACYLMQAVFGIGAGIETWRGAARAPLAILALGGSIALTGAIEVSLGVVAWLYALLGAVAALVVAFVLSRFVTGRQRVSAP
ncbi:MAG TPA: hypothetical protein VMS55_20505 [Myxococcota bacterium]|nr:hypothetical protein [Myxococcota bacterium]